MSASAGALNVSSTRRSGWKASVNFAIHSVIGSVGVSIDLATGQTLPTEL